MVDPVTIGDGTNKWLFDSNTKFVSLYRPSNSTGTVSYYDTSAAAYLVPAGRKFIILGISGTGQLINYDTVVDNYGTEVYQTGSGTAQLYTPVWIEIPAGNYVNDYITVAHQGSMFGIETTV